MSFTPPAFNLDAFHCPHCNTYAKQHWTIYETITHTTDLSGHHTPLIIQGLKVCHCEHCKDPILWMDRHMIYPDTSPIPNPNEDLRDDIKEDYLEARSILNKSPRGAAALLRLCVQKLCLQLGQHGANINDDIAALVRNGLSVTIQQSLDIVRVIGNNAVHPGHIDLTDTPELALQLFPLINLIAESMITQPRKIQEAYDALPQTMRDAIANRDRATS